MKKIVSTLPLNEEQQCVVTNSLKDNDWEYIQVKKLEDLGEDIKDIEVLFTNGKDVDKAKLKKMKKIKWIQCAYSGVNHMPLDTLKQKGIILTNARGVHRIQMSEYLIGMMLMIVRKFPHYIVKKQEHKWDPLMTEELHGKTVGFIGVGAVARETARKLKVFGVKTLGVKNKQEDVKDFDIVLGKNDLDVLLKESDFVIALVPLTYETEGMLGEKEFRLMKESAWFINVARGQVVDEKALIKALEEKWISGAALDVFGKEPLPSSSKLWDLDNVIITPHVAGPTPRYMDRLTQVFVNNLQKYVLDKKTEMVNVIDYNKGY